MIRVLLPSSIVIIKYSNVMHANLIKKKIFITWLGPEETLEVEDELPPLKVDMMVLIELLLGWMHNRFILKKSWIISDLQIILLQFLSYICIIAIELVEWIKKCNF